MRALPWCVNFTLIVLFPESREREFNHVVTQASDQSEDIISRYASLKKLAFS